MTIISRISAAMQDVLTETAEKAGRATGFIRRQRKLTGANFCQTVVLGWLENPAATLEAICQTGPAVGLEITPQGLEQRFTKEAGDCLYQVLQAALSRVIESDPVAIPVLQRFASVYVEDSSIVTLPDALTSTWLGCGGSGSASNAAVKLQVRWDMLRGTLDGPYLTNGRVHDRVATKLNRPLQAGSLLIYDLGYWKLDRFQKLADSGCFLLSRAQSQICFYDSHGKRWSQAEYVRLQTQDVFDIPVQLGVTKRVKARLVGLRVPLTVAEERRRKLKEAGKRNGETVSQARLDLCDWSLFVTNVPSEQLSPEEIVVLARMRWQIELLFKLWKSHGLIDESRSQKPWRILCELYAKLIAMIIQHWTFLMGNWVFPNRSLVKAAATVRRHAITLALNLNRPRQLINSLKVLKTCLAAGARINKSAKTPRTFQLLLALESCEA